MDRTTYHYFFTEKASMSEVHEWLFLAAVSAEGIHGRTAMCMDARFDLDEKNRQCLIDASTEVGRTITKLFTHYLMYEIGDCFRIERDSTPVNPAKKFGSKYELPIHSLQNGYWQKQKD